MRKKPNLIPRMERCSRVLIKDPAGREGAWRGLMPEAEELWLELGCGKGRFTVGTAAANPGVLMLAMERVPDAMVVAMEGAVAQELQNLFFMDADAALVDAYFAPGELDRLYINFCDPWPSRRHAKRRLTSPLFLERYMKVLKPGGGIFFKTDNAELFEYSVACFEEAGFRLRGVTRDLHADGPVGIMTGYEEKFYNLGTPIKRCEAYKTE